MRNVISVDLSGVSRKATTTYIYQYDYGAVLQFTGVDLPFAFEADFANVPDHGQSTTQIGQNNQVSIPDAYTQSGQPIYVWIFLHEGETDGETVYMITIPVRIRTERTSEEPTPVQVDLITQAIGALSAAVEQTGHDVSVTEQKAGEAIEAALEAGVSEDNARTYAVRAEVAESNAVMSEANALTYAQRAEAAENAAQGYAEDAEDAAERAEQGAATAGYMWIDMDQNGHLVYTRTDMVDVDLDLSVDGHLVMEAV